MVSPRTVSRQHMPQERVLERGRWDAFFLFWRTGGYMAEHLRCSFTSGNQLIGCENRGANFFSGHAKAETPFPDLPQRLSHRQDLACGVGHATLPIIQALLAASRRTQRISNHSGKFDHRLPSPAQLAGQAKMTCPLFRTVTSPLITPKAGLPAAPSAGCAA